MQEVKYCIKHALCEPKEANNNMSPSSEASRNAAKGKKIPVCICLYVQLQQMAACGSRGSGRMR